MRKDLIAMLSAMVLLVGTMVLLASADVDSRILRPVSLSVVSLIIVFLYRRLRRSAPESPCAFHAAAAIAQVVGAGMFVGGAGHTVAVTSLALRQADYGPLQVMRLTTGALLLFSGAMALAMAPNIQAGRRWAFGVAAAAGFLFWLYLFLLLPLRRNDGGVGFALVVWGIYLLSLGAAALASRHGSMPPASRHFMTRPQ